MFKRVKEFFNRFSPTKKLVEEIKAELGCLPAEKDVKPLKRNTIAITMKDGEVFQVWIEGDDISDGVVEPWKDFYKWFFAKDNEFYVFHGKDWEQLVRRSNIKTFKVNVASK